jgi:hypothetical protein
MSGITEGDIHLAVRKFLRETGWRLIAGQFPGGSDDDLPALAIMDPTVARDHSPDPRRHSSNKLVPDLVALKEKTLLVAEMKPKYSAADERKLRTLLTVRRSDLIRALQDLWDRDASLPSIRWGDVNIVPALGFQRGAPFPRREEFQYLLVDGLGVVRSDPSGAVHESAAS